FVGRQVAWIARLGPNRGQAAVSADGGGATTINLYRSSASSRRIVYRRSWPTVGPHTLEIKSTTGGVAVDLDAFVVIRDPFDGDLVGAGDIASCAHAHDSETAAVVSAVLSENASAVAFTLGDNVYPDGSAQYFAGCYEPTWGVFKADTRPVPGNHDYANNPGAAPYFAYFGDSAGVADRGWYRYESGTWRVYALNSECANGTTCYNAQLSWLKADLAAEPHRCVMAIWHRPLFSTGAHGNSSRMSDAFKALYDAGAEIVIAGHDHGYQRFAPADVNGAPDPTLGVREFVVGTGGAALYAFPTNSALLEVRDNTTYGVLRLGMTPGAYSWEFLPVPAPGAFTDSGTGACH
ncbi:MAG: metallophosphoesterase, partial [Chloroflexota bacterium]